MDDLKILRNKLGKNLQTNVKLAPYSTFKLGGLAKYFFIAEKNEDIIQAAKLARELKLKIFILAGGSNLLISDDGFNGLVMQIKNTGIELTQPNIIKADSGASWANFILFAKKHSLSGAEWGAGIPGTVGGAIRGNAGAFGLSIEKIIKTVEIFDVNKVTTQTMSRGDCLFNYRDSIFKHNKNLIILSGLFSLQIGDQKKIDKTIKDNISYREKTQPCLPSAGCIFKNIIIDETNLPKLKAIDKNVTEKIKGGKLGSAWLIEKAGLKGYKIGGAQISPTHANFIIKLNNNARADHVLQLISYIKQQIRDNYGIQLQEEVQYVGF